MEKKIEKLRPNEIQELIEKASTFGGKVQQLNPSTNILTPIENITVDLYGTMTITLSEEVPIENHRPISISFNYRNVNFHLSSTQYTYKGLTIVADSPNGAKALQVRTNERYVFPTESKVLVNLYRTERRGALGELSAKIIDVSKNGLGLIVLNAEEESLLQNDHVWIRSIHHVPLEKPFFGRIVYLTKLENDEKTSETRIGISLDSEIPDKVFSDLKQFSRLILI